MLRQDSVAPNHPKQKLLFFVAQEVDEEIRENVEQFVLRLSTLRKWLNGAPRFVDTCEEPKDASSGDASVETVGGYIEIFSALSPWSLPRNIDLQLLDEVTTVIDALRDFSHEHQVAFEIELDGVFVGSITDGQIDRSLSEGLLGEWRRHLGGESHGDENRKKQN